MLVTTRAYFCPSIVRRRSSARCPIWKLQDGFVSSDINELSTKDETPSLATTSRGSKRQRFLESLPGGRADKTKKTDNDSTIIEAEEKGTLSPSLDRLILSTAIPSMINLAVVPIVNSVDTFWVGRTGNALALAGQAAANQAFFTLYFLVNYLPTITAPLVASAVASGNQKEAQARVCESLFLSNLLGGLGTLCLVAFPRVALSMVLTADAPALEYAIPYMRVRGLSMIPTLVAATGFAAFRGLLDTVTPLKVSLVTNLVNLVLDPLMIFMTPLGFVGAAVATVVAETLSGITYLRLLLKRQLAQVKLLLRPPPLHALAPLLAGSLSMLGRQLAINVALLAAARRAQSMDPTGVTAAAYGIVMQLYSVGIVVHIALQGTAATLVPATLAQSGRRRRAARRMADRLWVWTSLVGAMLAVAQAVVAPIVVPAFSTVPAVQRAARLPALLVAILHLINGPVFAGEGIMLGMASYRDLMLFTAAGTGVLLACLASTMGSSSLVGVFGSLMVFNGLQAVLVTLHYLKWGPLAVSKDEKRRQGGFEVATS